MKVALIADDFSIERGTGIARYSQELLTGLSNRGLQVEAISSNPPKIPFGDVIRHTIKLPYQVLKKGDNFDLLHATAPITTISFPFIKNPKIVTFHDMVSILCESSGARLHAKFSLPFLFRIAARHCNKIIAVSTQTKEELIKYLKVPEQKIIVINNGISEIFKPMKKKDHNYHVIGYIGALAARKRIDYLIGAFYYLKKKYPELKVKLSIYGKKSQEHSKLVKLVKDLNLKLDKDIEFKGFVPDEKLVEVYNSFDVFV
ncbi:MAG: hypothetical protein DRI92_06495, partial [Aquificota bacterium]